MTLNIETDNAAFTEEGEESEAAAAAECARILRSIADKLDNGQTNGRCMDYNGNGVGEWSL